jgi:hypothetical protein
MHLQRNNSNVERQHYREQAILFFQSFQPLEQLSIVGPIDFQIVDAVLTHHGQSLKKLCLHPLEAIPIGLDSRNLPDLPFHFNKDCVLQLQVLCLILEELTIQVKRNMSRASEAELYRCFSKMRKLQALSLILDCSNWRVTGDPTYEPDFDKHNQEPVEAGDYSWLKRGHLRETFINCAIDEALACSIWRIISQNKTGRPLQQLKLWPTRAGEYGTRTRLPIKFNGIACNLARSWLFERHLQDDKEDYRVTELQQGRRLALEERYATLIAGPQDSWLWEIFYSIWPSRDSSKDFQDSWSTFRDDWSSFSL